MMTKPKQILRAGFGSPRSLKRAALFTSGAVTAAIVSVSASYGIVSTLFPRHYAPATIATTGPASVNPDHVAPEVVLSSAPATLDIDVTPLSATPDQIEASIAPAPPVALPDAIADSAVVARLDDATPDSARAPAPLTPATGPDVATVAALTTDTVTPTLRPAPRPQATTVALAEPAMPRTRPEPRPEAPALVIAEAEPVPFADTIPGIRPQPRPEVVRVAAAVAAPAAAAPTAPATAPEAIPARASGGLFSLGGNSTCGRSLARAMPRRNGSAPAGSEFFAGLGGLSGSERDAQVINQLARGNMPGFLHQLQPVSFRGLDGRGASAEIVICVTPDYLALGSDRDYVRVPLGLPAAARIAGRFDMTLPTPRMVDAIYAQADVHLAPAPMQAGPQMSSTAYLLRHNATIQAQLGGRDGLVAGQKKDVVMANRMANAPGRVAIYGWHRSASSPIQPVSTVHGANYADYSHGIRLVSKTAYLNGRAVDLDDLLGSSRYAYLLNKEGPVPGPVIRTASR